jgi:hypothetical protein
MVLKEIILVWYVIRDVQFVLEVEITCVSNVRLIIVECNIILFLILLYAATPALMVNIYLQHYTIINVCYVIKTVLHVN